MNLEEQKKLIENRLEEVNKKLKAKKNPKKKGDIKFYHFSQNNSGGWFEENEDLTVHVFIEAHNKEEANLRADDIGIYFHGCDLGIDCSCCGDRWSEIYDDKDGMKEPKIYNHSEMRLLKECYEDTFSKKAIIHYLDARKEVIIFKEKDDGHKHKWKQKYNIGKQCAVCGKWEDLK